MNLHEIPVQPLLWFMSGPYVDGDWDPTHQGECIAEFDEDWQRRDTYTHRFCAARFLGIAEQNLGWCDCGCGDHYPDNSWTHVTRYSDLKIDEDMYLCPPCYDDHHPTP